MSSYVYPPREFYFIDEYFNNEGLSNKPHEINNNIEYYRHTLYMIMVTNPQLFQTDENSFINNISIEIEKIFSSVEDEIEEEFRMQETINLFDDFSPFKEGFEKLDSIDEIDTLWENSEYRPFLYTKETYYLDYSLQNAIDDCNDSINSTMLRFKMWAVMDIPRLATLGMEAKDKTKYVDDKFAYTDVISQLQIEFNQEFDYLLERLREKVRLDYFSKYFQTINTEE